MNAKAMYRVSVAAAGFLLSAACYDDPVALTESEQPTFEEVPMETAASAVGSNSVRTVVDPTRPRFRIGFDVVGALSPNATITLTLQGEAVEEISSGKVSVVLPTMASMEYNGTGERPYYPINQKFPVVHSWTLPAMSAGGTWQRSFSLTLPANGYYELSVKVDTNAPASARDPWVMDKDMYFKRWMLVTESGGRLTKRFEQSVFPNDSIAPVPGPFRKKARFRTPTSGYSMAAYSSSAPVRKNVTYNEDAPVAAQEAHAFAGLYQGSGSDVELVANYSRTVPASGIVSFPCPATGHWLEGGVSLPATSEVAGGTLIAYWDAYPSDCGTTETLTGDSEDYLPWYNLKTVAPTMKTYFGTPGVPRIAWMVDPNDEVSSYNHHQHRIEFGTVTFGRKWTAAHEYAHAIHHRALGGLWQAEPACYDPDQRAVWGVTGYLCALQEGFADYAGNLGSGINLWNFETPSANGDNDEDPDPEIEGYVAAMFWDFDDSSNDNNDQTSYTGSSLATVFRTCDVRHGTVWEDRDDVSDIVWCMENRIVENVHNNHFPGIDAPDAQRATRGSGWNASHIRSTWLQNLTGSN